MTNEPGDNIAPDDISTTDEAVRLAAVAAAIGRLDRRAILGISIDETLARLSRRFRGMNNAAIRGVIREQIMTDYFSGLTLENKGVGRCRRDARLNAQGFDPNDPEQVEEFIVSQLKGIDFEKLIAQQSRFAIDKDRGRVD